MRIYELVCCVYCVFMQKKICRCRRNYYFIVEGEPSADCKQLYWNCEKKYLYISIISGHGQKFVLMIKPMISKGPHLHFLAL